MQKPNADAAWFSQARDEIWQDEVLQPVSIVYYPRELCALRLSSSPLLSHPSSSAQLVDNNYVLVVFAIQTIIFGLRNSLGEIADDLRPSTTLAPQPT